MTQTILTIIIVPIISAASALFGVWITQRGESRRRASEERRWYADYFLGRKIDALDNLFAALVDCHFTMNYYGNYPPSTLQEFKEKVATKEESYLMSKVRASIYLHDDAKQIMSSALGAFRQTSMAILLSLPDDECPANKDSYDRDTRYLDWANFMQTYESAVSCLENMLNPAVLERVSVR
jgi:hypothetical protein